MTTTAAAAKPPRARRQHRALVGWSFILPNFAGFALFTLVPVVVTFVISFTNWDAFNSPTFVGLANYKRMFTDREFWQATRNTLYYVIGHVPLTLFIALGLAMLVNQRLRGVNLFRTAMFIPYITSMVAVAVTWNMLFAPTRGPINQFLGLFIDNPPGWTSSTTWAMPAIIITSVWRDMGYYMILYLAGLQTIPQDQYEAAALDGVNKWQRFWYITWPSLRPVTFFVTIMLVIGSFKVFDLIWIMTRGGPGGSTTVLSQLIYETGISGEGSQEFGHSSAIALFLFVLVLGATVVQFRLQERNNR